MGEEEAHFAKQMRAGVLEGDLEERHALARIEERLFGRQIKPITFARYVLLEPCGRGSRGMVYRAYDPQLDRKVAIKLLLARTGAGTHEAALLREARAMARVSHANVIAVYDVGSYDEHDLGLDLHADPTLAGLEVPSRGVFVVMELLEGLDLREWLDAERRDWRAIIRAFVAAGRGLAAAHEAGLVHRDFKPTNVRVGVDGRIVVLDFGLARALADEDGTSSVVGTPMYMSPEQHRGQPTDARSDQYSFGVALYEALVGSRPFVGTIGEIASRKYAGDWLRIPDGLAVPANVWTYVRRCVEAEPAARFGSMSELLDGLEACLGNHRRRWFALATVPAAALAIAAFSFSRPPSIQPAIDLCSGAEARVARVWNDEVRTTIEQRLRSSGARYAETTWAEVRRELDDYTTAWAQQHREACEATHRGEQSETTLDLRMACLDLRLHEVQVVTTTLAHADVGVVENAVAAVNALGWLGACGDLDALRSRVRLPRAAAEREQIEQGHARLTEAKIYEAAGRYDDALAIAEQVAEQARRLGHAPLKAAADLRRAAALEGRGEFAAAERALLDALAGAEASRDEVVAADAWLHMVWVVGVELVRRDEGEAWLRLAEAAVARLGGDPLREATLIHNRAGLRLRQGRHELALADYLDALDAQIELLGSSDPAVAQTSNHIANTLILLQRYEEAWQYATRSLELRVDTLGADHPLVAASYNNMAVIRERQHDPAGALALLERALAIAAVHGTRTEVVSRSLARDVHRSLHQLDAARRQIERLLELPAELYPKHMSRETLTAELAQLDALSLQ
ncbi:MAG TPA: serine/threonine-protein kinase [Enhygromyxa sp.]|nr:serine/threonine-protein kinase [Enhygromyxa sp.]